MLGLDLLGLTKDEVLEAIGSQLFELFSSTSSLPSQESALKRVDRYRQQLIKAAIGYYLEKDKPLDEEKLEFIVTQGEEVLVPFIQKLYEEIKKRGLKHLQGLLMRCWEMYGKPTPLRCPRCGFRAVTPDLTCFVCGEAISERELKKANDFKEKLIEFAETADIFEIQKVLSESTVLWGETIKPSDSPTRSPFDVEVVLNDEEKKLLKEVLRARFELKRG